MGWYIQLVAVTTFANTAANIYIAVRITESKWTPAAITGATVASGNGMGSNASQLNYPNNLAVDIELLYMLLTKIPNSKMVT
jgi:hypothetical protein